MSLLQGGDHRSGGPARRRARINTAGPPRTPLLLVLTLVLLVTCSGREDRSDDGASGSEAAKRELPDPCTLISDEEAIAFVGANPLSGEDSTGSRTDRICRWATDPEAESRHFLTLVVSQAPLMDPDDAGGETEALPSVGPDAYAHEYGRGTLAIAWSGPGFSLGLDYSAEPEEAKINLARDRLVELAVVVSARAGG